MSEENWIVIPIPVHPDDKDLPISIVQLKMPSERIVQITIPIQGMKTLQNALDTLEIWKPTIVRDDPPHDVFERWQEMHNA